MQKEKSLLTFIHQDYEELELLCPKYRFLEEGYKVVIAGPKGGESYKGKHGYPSFSDAAINDIRADDFIGLYIPGGYAPDKLRRDPKVLELTRHFHEKNKLVAYICHAGWVPVSAKIVKGFKCTSAPSIKDDLMNAGATWVDESVVVDRNQISSRRPDDIPDFCREILRFLKNMHAGT